MTKLTNILKKIFNYIIHPLVGDDNQLSGKRLLGTALIIFGIKMGWYGVKECIANLPDVTLLVGTLLGAGLAFWGITEWGRQADMKNAAATDDATPKKD